MPYLYHLSDAEGLDIELSPPSLQDEGFVHLSSQNQVLKTARRWFRQAKNLKLVVLDTKKMDAVKWEDTHGHGEDFPHLYSPIPPEAISAVARMERNQKSREFEWPSCLTGLLSPLLEPSPERKALIEPSERFPERKLPSKALLCFFQEALEKLKSDPSWTTFEGLFSEIGPVQVFVKDDTCVCHPGVGGPLAAAILEELIALGCQRFLLVGGAGSLRPEQTLGHLVVPEFALRDEGVSHHYLPPRERVEVSKPYHQVLRRRLKELSVKHSSGGTWTTDGLYRETPSRIERRRQQGCLTVEMELASLLAVAEFRGVKLAGLLYCGDDLSSDDWDYRDWTSADTIRERLFFLGLRVLGGLD